MAILRYLILTKANKLHQLYPIPGTTALMAMASSISSQKRKSDVWWCYCKLLLRAK